jgi:hypothetical protein
MPWGVLAHSTHVRGIGTFEDGIENCRIQVALATGIHEEVCKQINLGHVTRAQLCSKILHAVTKKEFSSLRKQGKCYTTSEKRPDWSREI